MIAGSEKLKLVKELGTIRRHLPNVAGVNKLTLVKRVREIRQLLSVDSGPEPVGLAVDRNDVYGTYKNIIAYLEKGIEQVPEPLRGFDRDAIITAWNVIKSGVKDAPDLLYDNTVLVAKHKSDKSKAFEYFNSIGNVFDYDAGKIKAVSKELESLSSMIPMDSLEVIEEMGRLSDEYEAIRRDMNAALSVNTKNGHSFDEIESASDKYIELREKGTLLFRQINELSNKKYADKQAKIDNLRDQIAPIGQNFIDTLTNASKVTQEQADTWANAQVITKSAINRLKRIGYKEADIRRDMAEFYRITGGKLRQIVIDNDGSRRANARGIGSVEETSIYPGRNFDKTVLWHEMAHHLEADPAAKAVSNGFLLKRRKDEKVYSLRSLTGNSRYRTDEVAYKDEFIKPYIGKVYRDGVTEVWAMGIQYLSNPQDAALMLGKDPEMAALIAGYLQSDLTPGMKALQAAQNLAKDEIQVKRDDRDTQYDEAIKKLSDGVEIIDDGWFDGLSEIDKDLIFNFSIRRKSGAEFIGSWNGYRVFKGKFRSRKTNRVSKGYEIIYAPESSFLDNDGRRRVPHGGTFHEEMDAIKAALRIARDAFSNNIYAVSYKVFGNLAYKVEVIDYAGHIFGGES
ncbi:hypothetical protein [Nitrosomonas marina]|uniref:Uncharacterized protein n=1 Tax=Nitrosomonas marina TaxID=917 RepID=A0A1H8IZN1_9PROT|nr:hypothetical protein [Nitrosomonas marina]SEN73839.1 hypothetical protein SAMN05216325_1464 [Nitrosomonas marina]